MIKNITALPKIHFYMKESNVTTGKFVKFGLVQKRVYHSYLNGLYLKWVLNWDKVPES